VTKVVIACLAGPSFQEGSGPAMAQDQASDSRNGKNRFIFNLAE
jgi:hypothetical protein